MIRVKLMAQARVAAGREHDEITCGDFATVAAVLSDLAGKHGAALRRLLLDENGKPQTSVMLFVNAEQVPGDSPQTLCNGDELTIMPPISGG